MKYLFLSLMLIGTFTLGAQNNEIDTSFQFQNETGTRDFSVMVAKKTNSLAVVFTGEISGGAIEVELIDPSGKRESGFELNSSSGQKLQVTSGSGEKSKGKDSNTNKNTNKSTTIESDEETIVSVRKGSKTTSVSAGSNSVSISSGEGNSLSITSDGGVSVIKSNYHNAEHTGAKGVMVESIEDPAGGEWKVRMKSTDVTGTIDLVITRE